MPYDEALAGRIRRILHARPGIALSGRKMFGGIAFMLNGNMRCCLTSRGLMVRVGAEACAAALSHPHTGPKDLTGRPMRPPEPVPEICYIYPRRPPPPPLACATFPL